MHPMHRLAEQQIPAAASLLQPAVCCQRKHPLKLHHVFLNLAVILQVYTSVIHWQQQSDSLTEFNAVS